MYTFAMFHLRPDSDIGARLGSLSPHSLSPLLLLLTGPPFQYSLASQSKLIPRPHYLRNRQQHFSTSPPPHRLKRTLRRATHGCCPTRQRGRGNGDRAARVGVTSRLHAELVRGDTRVPTMSPRLTLSRSTTSARRRHPLLCVCPLPCAPHIRMRFVTAVLPHHHVAATPAFLL